MTKLKLTYLRTDNGFCRVYYLGPEGKRGRLYCVQDIGTGQKPDWQPHVCSKDGEPEYPFGWDKIGSIDPPPGDTVSDAQLRKVIWTRGVTQAR